MKELRIQVGEHGKKCIHQRIKLVDGKIETL